eukprot:SAG31_NODE_3079_length_4706_cov_3.887779_9_plen_92_part_00
MLVNALNDAGEATFLTETPIAGTRGTKNELEVVVVQSLGAHRRRCMSMVLCYDTILGGDPRRTQRPVPMPGSTFSLTVRKAPLVDRPLTVR